VIPEVLDVDDLGLAHRVDARQFEVRFGAVTRGTPDEPHGNSVANVDEVADQFRCVGVPRLAHLLELAYDRLPAYERPGLGPTLGGSHDGVGIEHLTKCIHVRRVPRLEAGLHDLHVLHRFEGLDST
jgi:hypothetical protein